MPIREFADASGVRWQVWATTPTRGNVRPQFAQGWLAFESLDERRRLAPVPEEWTDADDGALRALLARAMVITRGPGALSWPVRASGTEHALARATPKLEATVEKVREVIRAVEETLRRKPSG
ncbi:MAG TPA: hypothetical protein VF006_34400 [Longimicrobium sp.]